MKEVDKINAVHKSQELIKQLKAIRESKGVSSYELEKLTGIKASNIRRMEGGYMPSLLTVMKIVEALDLNITMSDKP